MEHLGSALPSVSLSWELGTIIKLKSTHYGLEELEEALRNQPSISA